MKHHLLLLRRCRLRQRIINITIVIVILTTVTILLLSTSTSSSSSSLLFSSKSSVWIVNLPLTGIHSFSIIHMPPVLQQQPSSSSRRRRRRTSTSSVFNIIGTPCNILRSNYHDRIRHDARRSSSHLRHYSNVREDDDDDDDDDSRTTSTGSSNTDNMSFLLQSSMLQYVTEYLHEWNRTATTTTNATSTTATTTITAAVETIIMGVPFNDKPDTDDMTNTTTAAPNDDTIVSTSTERRLNLTTTRYYYDDFGTIVNDDDQRDKDEQLFSWLRKTKKQSIKNSSDIVNEFNRNLSTIENNNNRIGSTNVMTTTTTPTTTTTATTNTIANKIMSDPLVVGPDIYDVIDINESDDVTTTPIPPPTAFSFMIAIPIHNHVGGHGSTDADDNDNGTVLLTEIESIQRAITYHCPILQAACISTKFASTSSLSSSSQLRIPLLYITIPDDAIIDNDTQDVPTTAIFVNTIRQLILKSVQEYHDIQQQQQLTMSVSKLEIDSYNAVTTTTENEILYTVVDEPIRNDGDDDIENNNSVSLSNTEQLYSLIDSIYQSIGTHYPMWNVVVCTTSTLDNDANDAMNSNKKLRLPIMRLPPNWSTVLQQANQQQPSSLPIDTTLISNEDTPLMLTSDQGGNGISPIFWIQYINDVFIREYTIRQIGIYPYSTPFVDELLPVVPDERLKWTEMNFPYIADRVSLLRSNNNDATNNDSNDSRGMTWMVEPEIPNKDINDESSDHPPSNQNRDDTEMEQRQRLMEIIAARQQARTEQSQRVIKMPGDRNAIFEKYRNGTLTPPPAPMIINNTTSQQLIPPFPHRDLAIGFWSMIRSPTGFETNPTTDASNVDAAACDNLILRVDGTIAGGPILDSITRQKAAGGSWIYIDDKKENDSNIDTNDNQRITNVSLQIRFIIPPKKDRVLVMEGQFKKLCTQQQQDITHSGNNDGDVRDDDTDSITATKQNDNDVTYICSGNVWIEDVATPSYVAPPPSSSSNHRGTKNDIGTFTIVKILNQSSPIDRNRQLTITVPKNVRFID